MTPAPTEQEARTVTLSDGNEWRFELRRRTSHAVEHHWLSEDTDGVKHDSPIPYLSTGRALTASDHRKIADVLDPAAAPSDTPPPLPTFDAFVAGVLLAITDGETDNIANFPMGTQGRLETLYEEMRP